MEVEGLENNIVKNKIVDDSAKILLTRVAEKKLLELLERVNDGYEAGRVSRRDLASWLVERMHTNFTDEDTKEIHLHCFNALNALTALVKRIQANGDVPPELRLVLMAQLGLDAPIKKKK